LTSDTSLSFRAASQERNATLIHVHWQHNPLESARLAHIPLNDLCVLRGNRWTFSARPESWSARRCNAPLISAVHSSNQETLPATQSYQCVTNWELLRAPIETFPSAARPREQPGRQSISPKNAKVLKVRTGLFLRYRRATLKTPESPSDHRARRAPQMNGGILAG